MFQMMHKGKMTTHYRLRDYVWRYDGITIDECLFEDYTCIGKINNKGKIVKVPLPETWACDYDIHDYMSGLTINIEKA